MLIAYIDLETDHDNRQIRDIGAICGEHQLHSPHIAELLPTIQAETFAKPQN